MPRNICLTAADGQTGFLIAELLLTHSDFSSKIDSLTALTMHLASPKAKELSELGAKVILHKPGRAREMAAALKSTGADTLALIPPAHPEKRDITMELVQAARRAGITNVLLLSSAGADMADPQRHPRLREFVELEAAVLAQKGDPDVPLGHSPCVIRAGFYAENLLVYAPHAREEGVLPVPVGRDHKFAPVALGDIAQVVAHVLSGQGEHGFDDKHRGQLMVVTGPMLATGDELAQAASKALGVSMEFEDISEAEAKKVLKAQSVYQLDESEKEYLLEYYSLVRMGRTNYISTTAFVNVTGKHPMEPDQFFETYAQEFKKQGANGEQKSGNKKRKVQT
ncbi:NAD(P)H azoreductase [Lasiodiplodia theobromae]|uniref:NAD(P)H azoreductase n=1 Tax=Lasiodiplodia theobromae TaxID=45133 RepID=A0A5N5CUN6_9PEZI|nr:NAD(P)H azoreductase [Lasiodiplodia theobromae]